MAIQEYFIGSAGPFLYDDADDYPDPYTQKHVAIYAPNQNMISGNLVTEDLTNNNRLARSDSNKTIQEVNDLTNWIAGGSNVSITDDGDGSVTIAATQRSDESIDDRVAALLSGGSNVSLNYDDANNTLTINATDTNTQRSDEEIEDVVAALLTGGTNVTLNYDDANDTLTINASGGGDVTSVFGRTGDVVAEDDDYSVIASIGDMSPEDTSTRNVHRTGIYTFNVNNSSLNGETPTAYWSVLGFGQGQGGMAELAVKWTSSGELIYYRSLRDTTDDWWTWRELWHEGNLSSPIETGDNASLGTLNITTATNGPLRLARGSGNASIIPYSSEGWMIVDGNGSGLGLNYYDGSNVIIANGGGNVGINDTGPNYRLDVNGSIRASNTIFWNSDKRLKDNIERIDNYRDVLISLMGRCYNRNDQDGRYEEGFIAQEVNEVLPHSVDIPEDEENMWVMSTKAITAHLVEGWKDHETRIMNLERENKKLKRKLKSHGITI